MENLSTGLLLMVVGLATVFLILFVVINLGKGLIAFVNKYIPEDLTTKVRQHENAVPDKVKKIIAAAVSELTKGKGIVSTIEKR